MPLIDGCTLKNLKATMSRVVLFSLLLASPCFAVEHEPLSEGASGRLVEHLQRTLNARLKPSPDLSIDGDFGSATRAAVERFQKSQRLEVTGVVGPKTWRCLSPLITTDAPVPSPRVVNAKKLTRQPPDELTGRPFVTCKAWAICDADSGKLLWGDNSTRALDIASTTKIMTAYIVLNLAQEDSKVLQETVTFSERADRTNGSTSGIRAGESAPVSEVLYGLLLPSGNDASVALAEHFGERLDPPAVDPSKPADDDKPMDPFDAFVAEMNRQAKELGMSSTRFVNPHGLTARGYRASAEDLLKLACAALKLPKFADYVGTRQRGATLKSTKGYQRNVVWKNTNRLLGIDGYFGVKTGTTGAAGACLVSAAQRGDRRLILVVLGSAASDARYTDSRNLYRWAWNQLATADSGPHKSRAGERQKDQRQEQQ